MPSVTGGKPRPYSQPPRSIRRPVDPVVIRRLLHGASGNPETVYSLSCTRSERKSKMLFSDVIDRFFIRKLIFHHNNQQLLNVLARAETTPDV